jgi:adenosylcobinamide-phosphate synthase
MALERRLNCGDRRFLRGAFAWIAAVLPPAACAALVVALAATVDGWLLWSVHAIMLYVCLGLRSLREHNLPIAHALADHDLAKARWLTSRIVSRDTTGASENALAKASAESLLENGNDAVFGTLFWFAVAGGPGAVLFRMANTLDAMWGYRTTRLLHFGCTAARLDDALNYLPARLTALSYTALAPGLHGKLRALRCWRTQAPAWSSPNAGPVMSSGAGAIGVQLGGAAVYDGEVEDRPALGEGRAAAGADISRAWQLVTRTTMLWLAMGLALAALLEIAHA